MDINILIANVKNKLSKQIDIESIKIEDKSFLHKINYLINIFITKKFIKFYIYF